MRSMANGRIQGADLRSETYPKIGWATVDTRLRVKTMVAPAA